jgi:glycosyltransferase involved in cell wall biosynthesis
LKQASECRSYLVLRDIFPEWAVDMGLIGRGPIYHYFKAFERRQYAVADAIGVQSPSNLGYLRAWAATSGGRLEVLNNWLADSPSAPNPMSIAGTALAGRTILVYAGNMGVAQGMDIVFELATELRCRQDIGFLFVGRGSEVPRLKALVKARALDNVMFFEEIDPADVKGLLMQCHVGLVALDPRHKTHNVPGKFLAYMQAGLPVLARINAGNDLAQLIEKEQVGRAYVGDSVEDLRKLTEELCDHTALRESMSENARRLSVRAFSVSSAVRQITAALSAS